MNIDYIQAKRGLVNSFRVSTFAGATPHPTCLPNRRVAHGEQLTLTVFACAVLLNTRDFPVARIVRPFIASLHTKAHCSCPFPSASLYRHD